MHIACFNMHIAIESILRLTHVQDVLASNQHQLLVPKGMNCTPRYQVDYAYAQGMLIMHKPWNKHNTLQYN